MAGVTSKIIGIYSFSRIVKQLLGVVAAVLRLKFLSPEYFGIWTMLKVIPNYAVYLDLGSMTAMRISLPSYFAAGDKRQIVRVRETVFTLSVVMYGAACLTLFFMAANMQWAAVVRVGVGIMACIIMLQMLYEFLISYLKADQQFLAISRINIFMGAGSFFVTVPLLYFFNLYGLLCGILIVHFLVVAFFLRKHPAILRFRFDFTLCKGLIAGGAPIMLVNFFIAIIKTSDRFVVEYFLGTTQLGYYGIGIMLFSLIMHIPGAAREVLEPQLMQQGRAEMNDAIICRYLLTPTLNCARLLPFVLGAAYISLPLAMKWFFPQYVAGVAPAQFFLAGVFFLGLSQAPRNLIIAFNLQRQLLFLLPVVILFNVVLSVVFIQKGFGLSGVAVSSVLSFAGVLFCHYGLLVNKLTAKQKIMLFACSCLMPLCFYLLFLLDNVLSASLEPGFTGVLTRLFAMLSIFFVADLFFWRRFSSVCKEVKES